MQISTFVRSGVCSIILVLLALRPLVHAGSWNKDKTIWTSDWISKHSQSPVKLDKDGFLKMKQLSIVIYGCITSSINRSDKLEYHYEVQLQRFDIARFMNQLKTSAVQDSFPPQKKDNFDGLVYELYHDGKLPHSSQDNNNERLADEKKSGQQMSDNLSDVLARYQKMLESISALTAEMTRLKNGHLLAQQNNDKPLKLAIDRQLSVLKSKVAQKNKEMNALMKTVAEITQIKRGG